MIHSVTLAADASVYSVERGGGLARVLSHTASKATCLYETKDKLAAVWASPSGALHAVGKSYHTNRTGSWSTTKLPVAGFRIWGHSDDDLFVGGLDGALLRGRGEAWTTLAELGDLITGIAGGDGVAYVAGYGFLRRIVGDTIHEHAVAGNSSPHLQDVICIGAATYYCSTDSVFVETTAETKKLATIDDDELYGVGVGTSGVVAHAGSRLLRLADDRLVEYRTNDDNALMVQRATYSTAITSNGSRIVAGGARSVLVDDGDGLVEWPALGAPAAKAKTAAKAAASPAQAKKKTAPPETKTKVKATVKARAGAKR